MPIVLRLPAKGSRRGRTSPRPADRRPVFSRAVFAACRALPSKCLSGKCITTGAKGQPPGFCAPRVSRKLTQSKQRFSLDFRFFIIFLPHSGVIMLLVKVDSHPPLQAFAFFLPPPHNGEGKVSSFFLPLPHLFPFHMKSADLRSPRKSALFVMGKTTRLLDFPHSFISAR